MEITMPLCVHILSAGLYIVSEHHTTEDAVRRFDRLRAQLTAILRFYEDEEYQTRCLVFKDTLPNDCENAPFLLTSYEEVSALRRRLAAYELQHDVIKAAMANVLNTLFLP